MIKKRVYKVLLGAIEVLIGISFITLLAIFKSMSIKEILVIGTDVLIYAFYASLGFLFLALAFKRYVDKLDDVKIVELKIPVDSKELLLSIYKKYPNSIIKNIAVLDSDDTQNISEVAFIIEHKYRSIFYHCACIKNISAFAVTESESIFLYNHPIIVSYERTKTIDKILKDI